MRKWRWDMGANLSTTLNPGPLFSNRFERPGGLDLLGHFRGAGRFTVVSGEQRVISPDFIDGPAHGVLAQVVVGGDEAAARQTAVAGMKQGVVAQLVPAFGGQAPLVEPFGNYRRGANQVKGAPNFRESSAGTTLSRSTSIASS